MQPMQSNRTKNQLQLRLDYRILCLVLLLVIVAMLALWRPWQQAAGAKERTITVTGDASIEAEPDEFVFNPTYEFENSDKQAALKDLSAKSSELVAALKKLGVPSSKIKTNADDWSYPIYSSSDKTPTYTLRLTVTATNKTLAQKVEDYLVGTAPSGEVTPQASFSTAKQKSLQSTARDQATKEARAKAEQSARNLGFRVGGVKSVDDSDGFGGPIYPMSAKASSGAADMPLSTSLTVQPGENNLDYSVTVTYYIK